MSQKIDTFDSDKLTCWQAQMIATAIHGLDPAQEPKHLVEEIYSWRGNVVLDELCLDLVTLLPRILKFINTEMETTK
jgi:hypothetical protein